MATFFMSLPSCLAGMDAYGSASHWARKLQATRVASCGENDAALLSYPGMKRFTLIAFVDKSHIADLSSNEIEKAVVKFLIMLAPLVGAPKIEALK